ncbi:MAG: ATP-binding protein [Nannocystaceae bacterium]
MGSMLSQVTDAPTLRPPRIVVHGKGGVGKTTFGASAPNPILMPIEDGEGILSVPHLPRPESFVDVLNTLGELFNDEHDYRTLVVDAIDKIEPMVWEQVYEGTKWDNIEAFGGGYSKGYKVADQHWVKFFRWLDALRTKGMTTIIVAHNHTKNFEDPIIGAHIRTAPKLHDRANALLYEWADVVGCLEIERMAQDRGDARVTRTAQTTGQRILYLEDTGAVAAKNRYSLPPTLMIPKENGYAVLRSEIVKALGLDKPAKATTTAGEAAA